MKSSMFELGLKNTTLGAGDFSSAVSGFCQVCLSSDPRGFGLRPKMCLPSANTENSRRTREKPLVPRVRWSFHVCLFSRVKISRFRAKAHLVFHWCLYNKVLFVLRCARIQHAPQFLRPCSLQFFVVVVVAFAFSFLFCFIYSFTV